MRLTPVNTTCCITLFATATINCDNWTGVHTPVILFLIRIFCGPFAESNLL